MNIIERILNKMESFTSETGKLATYIYLGYNEKIDLMSDLDYNKYYNDPNETYHEKTLLGRKLLFIDAKNHLGVGI